jgi:hypothetical protein
MFRNGNKKVKGSIGFDRAQWLQNRPNRVTNAFETLQMRLKPLVVTSDRVISIKATQSYLLADDCSMRWNGVLDLSQHHHWILTDKNVQQTFNFQPTFLILSNNPSGTIIYPTLQPGMPNVLDMEKM